MGRIVWGWTAASDPIWEYRAQLSDDNKAAFDEMGWMAQLLHANRWKREQESR